MAKNLSEVFKEAKKFLWDGTGVYCRNGNEFICHAINDMDIPNTLNFKARDIIQHRLGYNRGGARTVTDYLHEVLEIPYEKLTTRKVQKYRRDWLTSLEKEFAPKLKPRKGYNIHYIDGDIYNNELSNLVYVPEVKSCYKVKTNWGISK